MVLILNKFRIGFVNYEGINMMASDDPFADLIPQNNTSSDDPFADLIPENNNYPNGGFLPKSVAAGLDAFNAGALRLPEGILQALHIRSPESSKAIMDESERSLAQAKDSYPILSNIMETAGGITSSSPLMAIGGVGGSALSRAATAGAMQNALYGGLQYAEDNDPLTRLERAGFGGTVGAAFPLATAGVASKIPGASLAASTGLGAGIGGIGAGLLGISPITGMMMGGALGAGARGAGYAKDMWFPKNNIMQEIVDTVDDPKKMFANKQAARRINFNASPAESSGSEALGAAQGDLYKNADAAKIMQAYGRTHLDEQKSAIGGLISDISPNPESAAMRLKDTSKAIIKDQKSALRAEAKPYYDSAYEKKVDPGLIKSLANEDPNIGIAISSVLKDPRFSADNKGYPPNSIKILDQAKKRIDAQISKAFRDGDNHLLGVLTDSKNRLIQATDQFSGDYAKARSIYSKGAKPVEAIENSNIGRFSNYPDRNIENITNEVFNPKKYSVESFIKMRDLMYEQNPDAWNQGLRNYIEQGLDQTPGKGNANDFFGKFLKSDRQFNLLMAAAKYIPGAQQKLRDTKAAFENVINSSNARSGAQQAKTGMVNKNILRNMNPKDIFNNFLGSRYKKTYAEFVANPNWDTELIDFMNKPKVNLYDRLNRYQSTLSRIATAIGTQPNNQ
jgi:hypothetical protein